MTLIFSTSTYIDSKSSVTTMYFNAGAELYLNAVQRCAGTERYLHTYWDRVYTQHVGTSMYDARWNRVSTEHDGTVTCDTRWNNVHTQRAGSSM